jgi:hypothetical protein
LPLQVMAQFLSQHHNPDTMSDSTCQWISFLMPKIIMCYIPMKSTQCLLLVADHMPVTFDTSYQV